MTNEANFINLTPHAINETVSGRTFEASGEVARVSTELKDAGGVDGIPFFRAVYGEIEGLPEPKYDGTVYIVSGMVLAQIKDRTDCVAPGDLVRDENGKPVGCRGFKCL
jgi:hypothetical protein